MGYEAGEIGLESYGTINQKHVSLHSKVLPKRRDRKGNHLRFPAISLDFELLDDFVLIYIHIIHNH